MLACVSAAALSAFAPAISTPPTRQSCQRLRVARMDDSYDEMVQHEYLQNSNAPRPAVQRQILSAPRTLNAAELRTELHGPSSSAVPDLQSAAFERGLQMGFSLAQHLPAMPMGEPLEEEPKKGLSPCTIKLVGVGGGGGNTLNRVAGLDLGVERESCIEYVACNTDAQALDQSLAGTIIQIGETARGLGAGGKPEVGEASALESSADISAAVKDADMVFVTAGMGGGTGSGAAPVVANIARAAGCLTIGVVTTPFAFEGRVRAEQVRAPQPPRFPSAHHQRPSAWANNPCPPLARHSANLPPPQPNPRALAFARPAHNALRSRRALTPCALRVPAGRGGHPSLRGADRHPHRGLQRQAARDRAGRRPVRTACQHMAAGRDTEVVGAGAALGAVCWAAGAGGHAPEPSGEPGQREGGMRAAGCQPETGPTPTPTPAPAPTRCALEQRRPGVNLV